MKTRWGRQVELVETWIEIACSGLDDDVAERIAAEVVMHYDDAYDAAIESGMEPVDANEAALVSLGDPYKARDGFRQVHLTKNEKRRLYPSWAVLAMSVACVVLIWTGWSFGESSLVLPVFMTFLLTRSFLGGEQPIALIVTYHALFAAAIFIAGDGGSPLPTAPIFALCFVAFCEEDIRLQRKLRRITRPTT
jgi:hypothetical protein